MKYLIFATNTNKYRTTTGWILKESELFTNESMLHFNSRQQADHVIKKYGYLNCQSYAITVSNSLFKHCL